MTHSGPLGSPEDPPRSLPADSGEPRRTHPGDPPEGTQAPQRTYPGDSRRDPGRSGGPTPVTPDGPLGAPEDPPR